MQGILDLVPAGGGWTFVSAATAATSSTIAFTTMTTGFDYLIVGEEILPITDATVFDAELGITTPTYRTSGYLGNVIDGVAGGVWANIAKTGSIEFFASSCGAAASENLRFTLLLIDPAAATKTNFLGTAHGHNTAGSGMLTRCGGNYDTAEAHTAIQFKFSSNEIEVGEFYLYKRPNA